MKTYRVWFKGGYAMLVNAEDEKSGRELAQKYWREENGEFGIITNVQELS